MSRPLRLHIPGMPYHLFARRQDEQLLFREDGDRLYFLDILWKTCTRFGVECVSYCLMGTHYHAVVIPHAHPLLRMTQQLNSRYCQWLNRRIGRRGHVLDGRHGEKVVEDGSYLLIALRYLALNPVKGGRVASPQEWPWSSYAATMGLAPQPPGLAVHRIWRAFDTDDPVIGRERFGAFVAAGLAVDDGESTLLLGGAALAAVAAPLLEPHRDNPDFVCAERYAARPPLHTLFASAAGPDDIEDASRLAFFKHAYTLREIGQLTGVHPSTVWARAKRSEDRSRRLSRLHVTTCKT